MRQQRLIDHPDGGASALGGPPEGAGRGSVHAHGAGLRISLPAKLTLPDAVVAVQNLFLNQVLDDDAGAQIVDLQLLEAFDRLAAQVTAPLWRSESVADTSLAEGMTAGERRRL